MSTESSSQTPDDAPLEESGTLSMEELTKRDNHMCQICGGILYPRGDRVRWTVEAPGEPPREKLLVCEAADCYDGEERTRRKQRARQWNKVEPGISILYTRALLRELKQRVRLFAHSGRFLIVRRTLAVVGSAIGLVIATALIAGILGALAVSPQTSLVWARTVTIAAHTGLLLLTEYPWIGGVLVGGGYFLHTREREWHHVNIRVPADRDRREWKLLMNPSKADEHTAPSPEIFLSRPTWHSVAIASVCSLLGGIDWILISVGVLENRFGAIVLWTLGTIGVGVLLKRSIRSDVTEYGLAIRPVWWVYTSRYGAVLGGITITAAIIPLLITGSIGPLSAGYIQQVITIAAQVSPTWLDSVVVLTPGIVGSWYVTRRYVLVQSGRGTALLRIFTQPLSLVPRIRQRLQAWRASKQMSDDGLDLAETASNHNGDSDRTENIGTNGNDDSTASSADTANDERNPDVNVNDEQDNTREDTLASSTPEERLGPSPDGEITSPGKGDAPSASYQFAREQAFERDEYTCQLCGEQGYPYAQRGLAGWVSDEDIAAEDYQRSNLVTVCQSCFQEFERDKLDQLATLAKQRINDKSTTDRDEAPDDS
jgi:hypothetical protein